MRKVYTLLILVLLIGLTGCVKTPPPINYFTYDNGTLFYNGSININDTINISSLYLTEPVYEDLRFPSSAISIKGESNIPEETKLGYGFDPDKMEQLFIIAQMPHSRVSGSNVSAHWHWYTDDNTAGNVTWCIEYRWGNIDEIFDPSETYCTTDSSQLNPEIHLMTPELHLNGTNKTESSIIRARIYRDASNINDTYKADAHLLEFDIHYLLDRLGEPLHG